MNTNRSIASTGPKVMPAYRKSAILTGVLFILATAASLLASASVPALTDADYLTQFFAHRNQVDTSALLYIIGHLACPGIAVALYPVLKKWHAGLALGSVVFRTVEATFYLLGVVCLMSLPELGRQFSSALAADRTSLQAMGNVLVSLHDRAALLGVFAFCLGALMYYGAFFLSRLIPRWLSGLGIVAILMLATACLLSLFSGNRITSYIPLAAPIALQEMVLAVWLIVKGFNPSATAAGAAQVDVS